MTATGSVGDKIAPKIKDVSTKKLSSITKNSKYTMIPFKNIETITPGPANSVILLNSFLKICHEILKLDSKIKGGRNKNNNKS